MMSCPFNLYIFFFGTVKRVYLGLASLQCLVDLEILSLLGLMYCLDC